jgi:acid phosphatase
MSAALALVAAAALPAALIGAGGRGSAVADPATTAATTGFVGSAPTKILVVIEENHSYAQMRSGMPFLYGLSKKYGYATHWTAITHPSEPNYLAIAGGSTFGVTDDAAPSAHYSQTGTTRSVLDQALDAGKTAHTYAESMPDSCHVWDYPDRSVATPRYAVRHNPWVYFRSGRAACNAHETGRAPFPADAAANRLPNVGFLIPNLVNDAHDASLATADHWLSHYLAPVLSSSDFTRGRLVVVVTADEDDRSSGNTVLTSVLTPRLSHKVVTSHLTHYSLNRYIAQVLRVPAVRRGATAPDLRAAFGL